MSLSRKYLTIKVVTRKLKHWSGTIITVGRQEGVGVNGRKPAAIKVGSVVSVAMSLRAEASRANAVRTTLSTTYQLL